MIIVLYLQANDDWLIFFEFEANFTDFLDDFPVISNTERERVLDRSMIDQKKLNEVFRY